LTGDVTGSQTKPIAALFYDSAIPPVRFAASEIRGAYSARLGGMSEHSLAELAGNRSPLSFVIATGSTVDGIAKTLGVAVPGKAGPQSYAIRRLTREGRTTIVAFAGDPPGAMYGGLDLAEAIRLGTLDQLADSDHSPHIETRGIKFNVPLDVRTPSYSDNSDAAQANIPEMWSFDFWRQLFCR
jgi:alpha-glucuronidase